MAKAVKKKVEKPLEVKTPYPKEEKVKLSNDSHWGEKMVKLQDRVNELELTINEMHNKLKIVTGRMGL
jgi:hypothetical protein